VFNFVLLCTGFPLGGLEWKSKDGLEDLSYLYAESLSSVLIIYYAICATLLLGYCHEHHPLNDMRAMPILKSNDIELNLPG